MARIAAVESSLMNQMIAGKPVTPGGSAFAVVNDLHDWPMTFFIGTDGGLALSQRGESGNPVTLSLSKRLGLAGCKVGTLAVSQAQSADRTIVLAFTAEVAGQNLLHVIKPFSPSFKWADADASMLLPGDRSQQRLSVDAIYLAPHVGNANAFPPMYVAYKNPERLSTKDVCMVDLSASPSSPWQYLVPKEAAGFQLPSNPADLLAMQAGRSGDENGLFVLIREAGQPKPQLKFVWINQMNAQLTVSSLKCPPGASSLATFADEEGIALLVGGTGLFHYSSQEVFQGASGKWVQVSLDEAYQSPSQMLVAQSPSKLSVWSLCRGQLRYHQFKLEDGTDLTSAEDSVPLVSCAKSTTFGATLVDGIQRLFVLEESELQMLMQDEATEHWKTEPFTIPSMQDYKEFNSYTTVVTMAWEGAATAETKKLRFASSVQNNFTVNGQLILVGPAGADVQPDDSGRVTIILPVDDLGAPIYTLTPPGGSALTVNPMKTVNEKLGNFKTGNDLSKAEVTDENGKKTQAFTGDTNSLNDAARALQMLRDREADIRNGKAVAATPAEPPEDTTPRGWGFFTWFAKQLKKAAEWVVKQVGEAVHFVITLAGKAVSFIVNTVTQVAKAISSVLETIGAGIQKLIQLVGSFFKPADYIDMQRLLCNVVNHGLHWAWTSIDKVNAAVDAQLLRIATDISRIDANQLPAFLRNTKIRPKDTGLGGAGDLLKVINSPLGRWGQNIVEHGGKGGEVGQGGDVGAIFQNLISNGMRVMLDVESLLMGVKNDMGDLLQQDEFSIADLLTKLGKGVAVRLIEVLKSVVNLVLRFLSDMAAKIAIELNTPRDVPVLSALFKWQFGKDLTVLDALMFVLAIPLTLVFKVVSGGKSLSEISGLGDLLGSGAAWGKLEAAWRERERTRKWSATNDIPATGAIPALPERGTLSASQSNKSKGGETYGQLVLRNLDALKPILVPSIAVLWFNFRTMPKMLLQGGGGLNKKTMGSFVVRGLLWYLAMPKSDNDAEHTHRIVVHSIGAVRAFGAFLPVRIDGLFGSLVSGVQMWGLVSVIQVCYTRDGEYDNEVALKEVFSVLATQTTGIGNFIASDPTSAVLGAATAALFNNVSNGYRLMLAQKYFDINKFGKQKLNCACIAPV